MNLVCLPHCKDQRESRATANLRELTGLWIAKLRDKCGSLSSALNNYKMRVKNAESERMEAKAIFKVPWGLVIALESDIETTQADKKASSAQKRRALPFPLRRPNQVPSFARCLNEKVLI